MFGLDIRFSTSKISFSFVHFHTPLSFFISAFNSSWIMVDYDLFILPLCVWKLHASSNFLNLCKCTNCWLHGIRHCETAATLSSAFFLTGSLTCVITQYSLYTIVQHGHQFVDRLDFPFQRRYHLLQIVRHLLSYHHISCLVWGVRMIFLAIAWIIVKSCRECESSIGSGYTIEYPNTAERDIMWKDFWGII